MDDEDPSPHLLSLFTAWWTAPEDSRAENTLDDLFAEQAEREGWDVDELTNVLYETLRDENGELKLTVPIPVRRKTEEDNDE